MQTISIIEAQDLIRHVGVELREAIMLWGMPGVGKSEGVAQVAAELDALMVDVRLSQYDSVDLRGIPVAETGGLTTWCAPSTLPFKGNPAFDESRLTFLFLDEINSAAPSVAAVAYQLVNEKRVGEHVLHDNVVVIAAGNREGDKGVTNRMPTPLANRFTHAEVGLDVDAWCHYAQKVGLPPIGIAFMQFRKPLLSTFDPSKPAKAFATPRTWAKALRYYASSMPQHTKQTAMSGAVGEGPAAEFWAFADIWHKMIPLSTIEKDPKGAPLPERSEPGMSYALAVAISGSLTPQNLAPFHTYLCRLDPEFTVLAWQLAVKRDQALFSTKEFIDFSTKFKAVFV